MERQSIITCPICNHATTETMAIDACQYIYACKCCGYRRKPIGGTCCVYDGSAPCPPCKRAALRTDNPRLFCKPTSATGGQSPSPCGRPAIGHERSPRASTGAGALRTAAGSRLHPPKVQRTQGASQTRSRSWPIRWLGDICHPFTVALMTTMRCHQSSGTL